MTQPTTVKCIARNCPRYTAQPYAVVAEGAGDSGPFGIECARKIAREFKEKGITAVKRRMRADAL